MFLLPGRLVSRLIFLMASPKVSGDTVYAFALHGTSTKNVHLIRHGQATSNAAAGGAKYGLIHGEYCNHLQGSRSLHVLGPLRCEVCCFTTLVLSLIEMKSVTRW